MRREIVVVAFGWVVEGDVEESGLELRLSNCSVVRRWNTSRGIGELALSGDASPTLDPLPDGTVVNRMHAIMRIPVKLGDG